MPLLEPKMIAAALLILSSGLIDLQCVIAQSPGLPIAAMQAYLESDSKRITTLALAGADYATLADVPTKSLHRDHRLCWLLIVLDQQAVRKSHLPEIVQLCDQLKSSLVDAAHMNDDSQHTRWDLVELLYRKGRALGYMELPDVVAVHPVENPEELQRAFADNFDELDSQVDTTTPRFILLRIRKERRAGNRYEALRLLEIYRRNHPSPRWYAKKRQDMLFELGLWNERFEADSANAP